jgi:serine protease inhibitor
MNHIYIIDYYYDYEDYYSFFDFYSNEYIINYLVPKSINKNILDLIKDKNFLIEDEAVKEEDIAIDLSVPKFKREINLDIIPILKELGLDKLFNESYSTFNHPFIVENKKNYYLNQIFHKNIIELNEDGTAIKSIKHESSSNMIGNTLEMNALKINLDRPFIYIIKDKNKLPIFIGYIDNPTE